jgi:hypothetical protein
VDVRQLEGLQVREGWGGSRYIGTFADLDANLNPKRGTRREQAEELVKHARQFMAAVEEELRDARAEEKARKN